MVFSPARGKLIVPFLLAALSAPPSPMPALDWAGSEDRADGERLAFKVDWHPPWYLFFLPAMEAGEVEIRVSERTTFEGRPARLVTFDAKSSGTLAKLTGVKIDDRFEYYSDPETLCTLGARKRMAEGKRKREIEVRHYPDERRLHIREIDTGADPPKLKKDRTLDNLPECVQDVFSALTTIRKKELFEKAVYKAVVGDNDTVKEVEVRVGKREQVVTPAGRFDTWRVTTVAVMGGLFKAGGEFRLWLAVDGPKLPVRFEAKVNLGTVTGTLKSMTR